MTDDDDKRARSVGGMIHDDEDMPSDDEQEILDEVNDEVDGNIKISKDVRGYDDANEDQHGDESHEEGSHANQEDHMVNEDVSRQSQGGD